MCMYRYVFSHLLYYIMVNFELIHFQRILPKYSYDKMTSYIGNSLIVKHVLLWTFSYFITHHPFTLAFHLTLVLKQIICLDFISVV